MLQEYVQRFLRRSEKRTVATKKKKNKLQLKILKKLNRKQERAINILMKIQRKSRRGL